MKIKKIFLGVVVFSLGLLFAASFPTGAKAETIKWRMQVLWDPGTLPYKMEEKFAARVKELSNGRLDIKVFAPGSLVPTAQMLDALQAGMIDMMKQYEGYYIGKMPEVAFTSSLPLGFTDTWQFETWFWQLGRRRVAEGIICQTGLLLHSPHHLWAGTDPFEISDPVSGGS